MLRRRMAPALLALALGAALAACGTPVALRTATAKVDACDMALLAGELVVSAQGGLAVRNAEQVTEVLWPFGYSATHETTGLVLRDATGKIVAHEGQRVTMGGGGGANGLFNACAGTVMEVFTAELRSMSAVGTAWAGPATLSSAADSPSVPVATRAAARRDGEGERTTHSPMYGPGVPGAATRPSGRAGTGPHARAHPDKTRRFRVQHLTALGAPRRF